MFDTLLYEKQDGIAWVTLNRGCPAPRTKVRGMIGAAYFSARGRLTMPSGGQALIARGSSRV
jgi:hypothetical protein